MLLAGCCQQMQAQQEIKVCLGLDHAAREGNFCFIVCWWGTTQPTAKNQLLPCEGLMSVEVQRKPVRAKSAERTALTGFRRTSTLAESEWPRLKTVLSRKRVQFLHRWASIEMSFLSFSRGMFRLYRHVWTWYKSESDKYKTIVFNTF